jgi:ankyrin repeat protein
MDSRTLLQSSLLTDSPSPLEFNAQLLAAIRSNDVTAVKCLLSQSDIRINLANAYGDTALLLAARYGHAQILSLLVTAKGILLNHHNLQGETALMLAVKANHLEAIAVLQQHGAVFSEAKKDTMHDSKPEPVIFSLPSAPKASETPIDAELCDYSKPKAKL